MAAVLSPGFNALALCLQAQEAAMGMPHSHIRSTLQASLPGEFDYVHDVNGDDKSGDVVFSSGGKIQRAGYKIRNGGDKGPKATIDHENASEVTPRTVYESVAEIAKKKEAVAEPTSDVRLVESAGLAPLDFKESGAINPLVKIISPGRGSSGYYTKELLERDGPKIFKRGTLMYINHATAAEEAARPEGDYSKLAAVTTADAYWDQKGPDGPALYAPAKVFSGVAAEVAEKAPFTGVSIRASGQYAEAKGNGLTRSISESKNAPDGRPGLIGSLTHADSIDLVTKAGRDGKLLLESATEGVQEMDKTEIQAMFKEALTEAIKPIQAENQKLRERLELQNAPRLVASFLEGVRLPEPCKRRIVEKFSSETILALLPFKEGKLDSEALKTMVENEGKRETSLLMELGYATNPASFGSDMSEADVKADIEVFEADKTKVAERLADIFVGEKNPDNKQRESARVAFINGRAA